MGGGAGALCKASILLAAPWGGAAPLSFRESSPLPQSRQTHPPSSSALRVSVTSVTVTMTRLLLVVLVAAVGLAQGE